MGVLEDIHNNHSMNVYKSFSCVILSESIEGSFGFSISLSKENQYQDFTQRKRLMIIQKESYME